MFDGAVPAITEVEGEGNMNNIEWQGAEVPLRLGPTLLARGSSVPGEPHLWTLVFKSRKSGFDYLGQATLCARRKELRLEIFNDHFYSHFPGSRRAVRELLEKNLLALLSGESGLPDTWREVVRALRQGPVPAAGALPATRGGALDLDEIYARLNQEYFGGRVSARVMWGRDTGNHNRSGFRFGSYDGEKKVIRVHPRLRQDFVPREVLELTVYHEMCHQWVPAIRKNGMWRSHHPAFKKKEKEYRHYEAARRWEKQHWRKLLRPVAKK
jgi:hypothetical protein